MIRSSLKRFLPERLKRPLRRLRQWRPIVDYRPGHKNAVFLAGSSRSGTTWVADLINYRGDYRYMFEPFAPTNTRHSKLFRYLLYIRPGDDDPKYLRAATTIVSGRTFDRRAPQHNRGFVFGKRVIKEVRAQLWLRWLHQHFPGLPIILLMRHPCAVTLSRTKRKLANYFNNVFKQPELFDDYLNPFRAEIEQARAADAWEQRMFTWCIEHYVPLRQFRKGEIHLAFYEHLAERPKEELGRIFAFLGRSYDDAVLEALKRPSSRAKEWSAIVTGESLIGRWKSEVTDAQMRRSLEILSLFGLDKIYSDDPMPNAEAAYAMLKP
jgi:hypothetical protein